MRPSRRQAAQAAATRISAQASEENTSSPSRSVSKVRGATRRAPKSASPISSAASPSASPSPSPSLSPSPSPPPAALPTRLKRRKDVIKTERPMKRRKAASASPRSTELHDTLFGQHPAPPTTPYLGPDRRHALTYHRPLLLRGEKSQAGRAALLSWFDATSTTRKMPWRKPWFDPAHSPRDALERWAYEVWISEIMLQQTRVSVVIDYWNRWMAQWPTIHDLAAADVDDVVLAWRGLGYYSRARRIHEAAGVVVGDADLGGLLPADPRELEARVPGVGRYTAGAISSIVFGRAVPMVDGNVLRVLSRQLGIYGNVKSDKAVIDVMWAAADALVKAAAADGHAGSDEDPETGRVSGVPGRWGQALMELGSTLCTPKPDCEACPISATCRAFNEGLDITRGPPKAGDNGRRKEVVDIEDLCGMCDTFEDVVKKEEEEEEDSPRKRDLRNGKPTSKELSTAITHARKFPRKVVKKPVREEETVVCAIRRADGRFLLHRRPEKGLLAGLWELPSHTLPSKGAGKAAARKAAAVKYLDGLRRSGHAGMADAVLRHAEDLGAIPWLFSHIKLTMHVHVFDATFADEEVGSCADLDGRWRWEESEVIDEESMGTGMRKCWALAKEAARDTFE